MVRFRRKCWKAFVTCFACAVLYVCYNAFKEFCACRESKEVGYFDLCAKGGNCEEFRVRSNLHGVMLEKQCAAPVESFRNSSSECTLPVLDPFNKNIMKFMHKNKVKIQCPGKRYTTYKNGVLSLNDKDNSVRAVQVRSITRKQHSDWGYVLTSKTFNFPRTNSSKINEEFLRIDINTSPGEKIEEFHAQVVAKEEVLKRKVDKSGLKVNVLMVGFDSTSSAQMQRALPKVYRYLKDDLNSYIFRGYSIVGDGTTPQLTALLTGHTEAELPEARRGYTNSTTIDSWPWIFKEYRKHGYATMYSEDDPGLNAFNFRLHGFKDPPVDHYARTFWQATPAEGSCVKASVHLKLHLSYVESFMRAYKNTPKFGFAFLSRISHTTDMNSLRSAEEYVLSFLKSLKETGLLDNTILMMFSDHGMRFGDARATMQCKLEERLPFLSITLPKRLQEKHRELGDFLKESSQKLTSPFDMHATLHHILNHPAAQTDSTKTGASLFGKIPDNRGCNACGIPEHYCPCVQLIEVPVTHLHIEKAAEGLVDHINGILKNDKMSARKCAKLKLAEIKSAHQNLKHPKLVTFLHSKDRDGRIPVFGVHRQDYECNYHLLVRTSPGDALFEASVQLLDGKRHFENDISRINRYGEQPKCIAEEKPYLRKFCFCKELF